LGGGSSSALPARAEPANGAFATVRLPTPPPLRVDAWPLFDRPLVTPRRRARGPPACQPGPSWALWAERDESEAPRSPPTNPPGAAASLRQFPVEPPGTTAPQGLFLVGGWAGGVCVESTALGHGMNMWWCRNLKGGLFAQRNRVQTWTCACRKPRKQPASRISPVAAAIPPPTAPHGPTRCSQHMIRPPPPADRWRAVGRGPWC